jgi:hypothetical protein
VHAERRDGAWTHTVLPAGSFYSEPKTLRVGADGTLVLGIPAGNGSAFAVAVRPQGGTWTLEEAPEVTMFSDIWFAAGDGGRATIMFERSVWGQLQYWSVRRDAAGGYSPAALVATGPEVVLRRAAMALAPDGARSMFVVALADDAGVQHEELFVRGATGGWRRMRIGPWEWFVQPKPSFAANGKAFILGEIARAGSSSQPLPVFAER